MSWQATSWAKETRGHRSFGQKLLLMILADYAHPDNWHAWPTQEMLAEHCEMSRRQVIRILKELENKGFIKVLRGGRHNVGPSIYLLNPQSDIMSRCNDDDSVTSLTVQSDISDIQSDIAMSHKEPLVITSKEPSYDDLRPRWWLILSNDRRWPTKFNYDNRQWVTAIEQIAIKKGKDIEKEALEAVAWLTDNPDGRRKKNLKRFFRNWINSDKETATTVSRSKNNRRNSRRTPVLTDRKAAIRTARESHGNGKDKRSV